MRELISLIATLINATESSDPCIVTDLASKAFDLGYSEANLSAPQLSGIDLLPVLNHMRGGQKIDAIKELRTQTGCGLKVGKDFVEALLALVKDIGG